MIIKCERCGRESKHYALGLCKSCWVCQWVKKSKYWQRLEVKKRNINAFKKWYSNPENKEKHKANLNKYYNLHREKLIEYQRKYRQKAKENRK